MLHAGAYTISRQPSLSAALVARLGSTPMAHRLVHELPTRTVYALLVFVLPASLCAGWAAALASSEPEGCFVYGLGVLLVPPAVACGAFSVGLWRYRRYAVNGRVLVLGALALSLPLLHMLLLVRQRPLCPASPKFRSFPHTALTAITMAASMLPVASIVFLSLGRVGSGRVFPSAEQQLSPLAQLFLVACGFRASATRPRAQKVGLYLVTLGLLALYTYIVYNQMDVEPEQGTASWSTLLTRTCWPIANLSGLLATALPSSSISAGFQM